uniref:Uncharacterized protein n=1 Tax=Tetranychus urticae TaxID=32264 RepID=T1JPT0_TETUR
MIFFPMEQIFSIHFTLRWKTPKNT